jgi:nitroimidazol reductase NimA-like FMN-containing flavoprotein (pyridoxamine 5'-phosphate oxidase superfamily)
LDHHQGAVYFHGSKIGEKMSGLASDPRAEFVVYEAHAFLPSYFSDAEMACPATVYFRSVRIRGNVAQVEDSQEKAAALGTLMRSMQPEGGYAPIDAGDPGNPVRITIEQSWKLPRVSAHFR